MPSARVSNFTDDEPDETDDSPASAPFTPSAQQQDIFDWFAEGDGNLVVEALAGTGKTTTILRAIDFAPEDNILLCAFGKKNQEVLEERVTNPRAKAQTFHSLGRQAVYEAGLGYGWTRLAKGKFDREDALAAAVSGSLPWGGKRLVAKLVTKARELCPETTSAQELIDLAADFDLLPPAGEALTAHAVALATLRALDMAQRDMPQSGIDYADMIFLPMRLGLLTPKYDMVVVDEYQDLTPTQLRMARAVCQPWGRIVLVGDRNQAIFGFRGADMDGAARLTSELKAAVLPLTTTYRCPRKVVAIAQTIVPSYTAAPEAPEGIVDAIGTIYDVIQAAKPGDFILSRKNAPLARIAMSLLRAGKRAKIQGRQIGQGLQSLIRQLAKGEAATSVPAFLQKVRVWEEKQIDRLIAMGRQDRIEAVADQAATLFALSMEIENVAALASRVDYLFTDSTDAGAIVGSTVHRAKGLEADRVFVLRSTFFMPPPCKCGHRHPSSPCKKCSCITNTPDPAKVQEERNLWYVAVTRAKRHLSICEEIL